MSNQSTNSAKVAVQRVGRFLSAMVMPNIGAFLAWGLITALFIPTGWIPNESLAGLVGPMITYLLPLLIGYTGGKLVHGERGGVVGAVATVGVIVGSDIPMFLGAMLMGPFGGWVIKKFDQVIHGKVREGFEMLVNTFSSGIIGAIIAVLAFLVVSPIVTGFSSMLGAGVDWLVSTGALPLVSILVEPAKILFLNNTINHGVFTPLGTQQALEAGKSLVFLIEANPGPGLGLLLAYMFFGRGTAKNSAPAAAIIHFFGGIHEIYFPFVLMKPKLIIAMIAGGMTNVTMLMMFDGGLRAPASPGSVFAVALMTPPDGALGVALSVIASCAVTFVVAALLLKFDRSVDEEDSSLDEAQAQMKAMKAESKGTAVAGAAAVPALSDVKSVVVACDAGMGSSAMGATMLRKKLDAAGLQSIASKNVAINNLTSDIDMVITHKDLTDRARQVLPTAQHLSLTNFLDGGTYDAIVAQLKEAQAGGGAAAPAAKPQGGSQDNGPFELTTDNVFLGLKAASKEEAVRFAGQKLLEQGAIEPEYIDGMLEREKVVSTYLGQSLAMPHGVNEVKDKVIKTCVVVCQYPEGVFFGPDEENVARLVVGLAAKGDEHMEVMSSLAQVLENPRMVEHLASTKKPEDIVRVLDLS